MRNKNEVSALYRPLLWVGGAILAVLGIKTALNLVSGAKSVAKSVANNVQGQVIQQALNQYGIADVRVTAVQNIVNEIYAALHKEAWFGWGEDETKAVEQFNLLQSIPEAKTAALIYKEVFKKSLYDEYQKYLYSFERTKLKSYLYEAIKGM